MTFSIPLIKKETAPAPLQDEERKNGKLLLATIISATIIDYFK